MLEGDFDTFLDSLRLALEITDLRPVRLPKRLSLKRRFVRTRPRVERDEFFMSYCAEWLATLLLSEAPEGPIRERAIEKAGRRRDELRIKKPALEVLNERIQRNAQISAGPARRPVYPGGEHVST
jgi:hypothetical protein